MMNAREAAARTVAKVIVNQHSLDRLLPAIREHTRATDRALYQALTYGTLREYGALSALRDSLLDAPLRANGVMAGIILNLGIYQLLRMSLGDHGVVNETVGLSDPLHFPSLRGLINAVLRRVQRTRPSMRTQLNRENHLNLPPWVLSVHRERAEALAEVFSAPPPMTLRVRAPKTPEKWIADFSGTARANPLHPQAVTLTPACPVDAVPGFGEGLVSVQDAAAQWAATLLAPQNGERILDACAAPGGKTCHLLERAPGAHLLALDRCAARLEKVRANLDRLRLAASCRVADATQVESWWDGQPFAAILLDAPCSGSGILHRHPDIAWRRTPHDLDRLARTQLRLLTGLWPTLAPGGRLLYATCSILPRENEQMIARFLDERRDARLLPIALPCSEDGGCGVTHYPDRNGDGFFYALIGKTPR